MLKKIGVISLIEGGVEDQREMAPVGKVADFHREGDDWFCSSSLPSDITLVVDGVKFHVHKFPLMSKCGRIAKEIEKSLHTSDLKISVLSLEEFPGGAETFLAVIKFCYIHRIELTARKIVAIFCAADYLEMTNEYGEDNLLSKSEDFFHDSILKNWKDCILALQSCESFLSRADKLQIVSRCLHSLSVMVCTDPSLFGWPMLMYGSLQSPGGSILWNGINTGAKIQSSVESDWWYEDVSYLSVPLFERLIHGMEVRGIKPENLVGGIMYYCRKHLPGLGRWQGGGAQSGKNRTVASFSMTSSSAAAVNQRVLLESIAFMLPEKKDKSFCRFLLGLLRVALILGVNDTCQDTLERKIGMLLDLATLDGLLIPSYSDSDTLYYTDCVERIIKHFVSSEPSVNPCSPTRFDLVASPSSEPLKRVAKLVDNYLAEVASDASLKPEKVRSLAETLPESSRPLHDGLYRALDIYFKAHPWLLDKDKEELCNIIDFGKLTIDACAHASQNDRLPLRIVLQVLFFEQLHLRSAIAGHLHVLDTETAPMNNLQSDRTGQMTVVRENRVLKVDMQTLRSKVGNLEEEFSKIRQEMRRVKKSRGGGYIGSPKTLAGKFVCKLLPQASDAQRDVVESTSPSPRASRVQIEHSGPSRLHKSL